MGVMAGFQFTEAMSGSYTHDGVDHPISFSATARAADIWHFLRDRTATLDGVIDAAGLAENAHMEGSVRIDPIVGRVIRYEFSFTGSDGNRYRFAGQKDISPWHPVETITTLPAEITDEGGGFHARALMHFQGRDLVPFLASFRPHR